MSVLKQYITFLKEYKKLLERGINNIFNSNVSNNFIWIDDVLEFINYGIVESKLPLIFSDEFDGEKQIFSISKPYKPTIEISKIYIDTIEFDESKNRFRSVENSDENLKEFIESEEGKKLIGQLEIYKKHKEIYSKLFRAYNDIKNDSNIEIVLSVGLFQYSRTNHNGNLSKTNQHLFHFPLSLDIDGSNSIHISFSDADSPYIDFFFLNNVPIEKEVLTNLSDRFNEKVFHSGFEYIYSSEFKELISKYLQQISSSSEFNNLLKKPDKDYYKENVFGISFSPAINVKQRKPRFFEKLTESIIEYDDKNNLDAKLFNLLVRNPESIGNNSYPKNNFFRNELYENYESFINHLDPEEDFSVFFPLPFNTEQKQIYENYLKNRLTVVTGPPGTGKSHTIVNILCTLLAQGKRVLVTAQTDKALESLLDKIPNTFDDLIFTKIQLENDQNRFSLEKSINNISKMLTDSFFLTVENKIIKLDKLKSEYSKLKLDIISALEKEYQINNINDTFYDLRAFEIVEKFESKDSNEWNWIKDFLSKDQLENFEILKKSIIEYRNLSNIRFSAVTLNDEKFIGLSSRSQQIDFEDYLRTQEKLRKLFDYHSINENFKDKILTINLDYILDTSSKYSNNDIVIKNLQELSSLENNLKLDFISENLSSNKNYSDLTQNATKYLLDIESILPFVENGKVNVFTRLTNSDYKKVSYLEHFTINGRKCNERVDILKLKKLIENLRIIQKNNEFLQKAGFNVQSDETSNLIDKINELNVTLLKLKRNKEVLEIVQFSHDFVNFSEFAKISQYDINSLSQKAIYYKSDFNELKSLYNKFVDYRNELNLLNSELKEISINYRISDFLPIYKIKTKDDFERLLNIILDFEELITKKKRFRELKRSLIEALPATFEELLTVNENHITKENFEYAFADNYLSSNDELDFQKTKEEISFINKKIFDIKCDILFDLAKSNFRKKFDELQINDFINLLEQYRYNQSQSIRKIKDQTKYQILTRKNSIDISKRLSCWVMKFNDVLNAVGNEPETFDCIIVDEASQLDFNSLILGYYAENMIVVGDDKQTSPSSLTGADGNDFDAIKIKYLDFLGENSIHIKSDNSLFMLAKMVAGTSNLALKEHFRCVPEIIEFSKFHFYDNSIRPLKQINSDRLSPKEVFFVEDSFLENKVVQKEIDAIKEHLRNMMLDSKYQSKTIGVVSLGLVHHTEKLKDIKEDLSMEFGKDKIDKHKLIIEDSPKFQGDERDVMIVSLGVGLDAQKLQDNENAKPRAIITDQDEFKKINVALSRAKEQMILFHSVSNDHLQQHDFRNRIISFFYEELPTISPLVLNDDHIERFRHNVPIPFDSWFEYDIAKILIENGYSYIQPQYQVKERELFYNQKIQKQVYINFKIDLVVHNNGKMIAIECDGDPYHTLPEDVAYDIERQEFLERVGWKVYRVLYSSFKKNPTDETRKMMEFIERNSKKDFLVNNLSVKPIENYKVQNEKQTVLVVNPDEEQPVEKGHYKSKVEIDTKNNQQVDLFSFENDIFCYVNFFDDNTYKIQNYSDANSLFSLPIKEKHRGGFLLQCYDNGHINKVTINSILNKKLDYHYSNGQNPNAKILYLKIIEENCIISMIINRNGEKYFKSHLTEKIPPRELLQLQGYKTIYQEFEGVEYYVLPLTFKNDISRLIFTSFNAEGKLVKNNYYKTEWELIRRFIPQITY